MTIRDKAARGMAGSVLAGLTTPGAGYGDQVARAAAEPNSRDNVLKRAFGRGRMIATMASPPTVGSIASSSAISGSNQASWNSTKLSFYGADWQQVGANSRSSPKTQTDGSGMTGVTGSVWCWTDGTAVEFIASFSQIRIYCSEDGGPVQLVSTVTGGAANGAAQYIPITCADRRPRLWRFDCNVSTQFYGIKVGVLDTIWPYRPTDVTRCILMGDSFGEGSGATHAQDGYVVQLGHILGITDMRSSSLGGTGLIKTNGARVKYRDRCATDVIAYSPTWVIIQGTQNDNAYAAADLQAEFTALVAQLRAGISGVRISFLSVWNTTGTFPSSASTNNAALVATATALGCDTIDWSDYITGTGRVGATTGDGNADYYVGTDSTHPSTAGHLYRAVRLADQVRLLSQAW